MRRLELSLQDAKHSAHFPRPIDRCMPSLSSSDQSRAATHRVSHTSLQGMPQNDPLPLLEQLNRWPFGQRFHSSLLGSCAHEPLLLTVSAVGGALGGPRMYLLRRLQRLEGGAASCRSECERTLTRGEGRGHTQRTRAYDFALVSARFRPFGSLRAHDGCGHAPRRRRVVPA